MLKFTIRIVLLLMLSQSLASFAASKEIVQLQRDVALVQNDVNQLQRTLDQGLGGTNALTQQTLDRVNEIHAAEVSKNANIARNWEKLNLAIANLTTRLDRGMSEYLATREAIAGLTTRLERLEQRLEDIGNSVTHTRSSAGLSFSEALGGPPPGMTAEGLFQSALRDKLAGHLDLAVDEFTQYVHYYGNTELASSSQFHIGEIQYLRGELAAADISFTAVIERYPKSGKAPDALFLRALVREKQGDKEAARADLNRLLKSYPGSDAARRAANELKRVAGTGVQARSR
jgi:tol-pal system protein YbgF